MANDKRLRILKTPLHAYAARDTPGEDEDGRKVSPQQCASLLERLVAPCHLELRVLILPSPSISYALTGLIFTGRRSSHAHQGMPDISPQNIAFEF
jgi:hypothetical protein